MGDVTQLYTDILRGVDLTPSDQVVGLLLLRGLQQIRRARHAWECLVATLGREFGARLASIVQSNHPSQALSVNLCITGRFSEGKQCSRAKIQMPLRHLCPVLYFSAWSAAAGSRFAPLALFNYCHGKPSVMEVTLFMDNDIPSASSGASKAALQAA
jgi:hypothetical protein